MIGPSAAIYCLNLDTTDPEDPNTLLNLTIEKTVFLVALSASYCKTMSAIRLEQPIILVGRTALSVEIKVNDNGMKVHSLFS